MNTWAPVCFKCVGCGVGGGGSTEGVYGGVGGCICGWGCGACTRVCVGGVCARAHTLMPGAWRAQFKKPEFKS